MCMEWKGNPANKVTHNSFVNYAWLLPCSIYGEDCN